MTFPTFLSVLTGGGAQAQKTTPMPSGYVVEIFFHRIVHWVLMGGSTTLMKECWIVFWYLNADFWELITFYFSISAMLSSLKLSINFCGVR